MKFYPLKKGEAGNSFSHAEGGGGGATTHFAVVLNTGA